MPNPTAIYEVQFNGTQLPGYAQNYDDPLDMRVLAPEVAGRDGGSVAYSTNARMRPITLHMRVISRLENVSGLQHLNDCLEQYREALATVSRVGTKAQLFIGDTDRYLNAVFERASLPLTAPDHKTVQYQLSFRADPWYISTTTYSSNTRTSVSSRRMAPSLADDASLASTLPMRLGRSIEYASGRFAGRQGLLPDSDGDYVVYPTKGTISKDAQTPTSGSIFMWLRPQFASTYATDRRWMLYLRNSSAVVTGLIWNHTAQRFAIWQNGTITSVPSITFASNDYIFFGITYTPTGTTVYAGKQGGTLQSATVGTSFFGGATLADILYIGGHPTSTTQFSNSTMSDVLFFSTELTLTQVTALFNATTPYDPFDTALPTTLLASIPFNGSRYLDSISNSIFMDTPDSRIIYPVITLAGDGSVTLLDRDSGKEIAVNTAPDPEITIDTGRLTVTDEDGINRTSYLSHPNFGIKFPANERVELTATVYNGDDLEFSMDVTPRFER